MGQAQNLEEEWHPVGGAECFNDSRLLPSGEGNHTKLGGVWDKAQLPFKILFTSWRTATRAFSSTSIFWRTFGSVGESIRILPTLVLAYGCKTTRRLAVSAPPMVGGDPALPHPAKERRNGDLQRACNPLQLKSVQVKVGIQTLPVIVHPHGRY